MIVWGKHYLWNYGYSYECLLIWVICRYTCDWDIFNFVTLAHPCMCMFWMLWQYLIQKQKMTKVLIELLEVTKDNYVYEYIFEYENILLRNCICL